MLWNMGVSSSDIKASVSSFVFFFLVWQCFVLQLRLLLKLWCLEVACDAAGTRGGLRSPTIHTIASHVSLWILASRIRPVHAGLCSRGTQFCYCKIAADGACSWPQSAVLHNPLFLPHFPPSPSNSKWEWWSGHSKWLATLSDCHKGPDTTRINIWERLY